MNCSHLGSVLVCALALALSACEATSESAAITGEPSAEQVDRWVAANRANLPTDYDALGRLPMPYRLAVFGSLPPATRSALFQQQFDRYASAHPDRSAEQQAVLERARQLFTVSLYEAPPESPERPAPERAPLAAFHQQALAAFGREDTIRLFATIGPVEPDDLSGNINITVK